MVPKRTRFIQAVVAALTGYLFLVAVCRSNGRTVQWKILPGFTPESVTNKIFDHVQNDTLGFEHIYAISLPERTDKRDFLTLAASVSGFKVEWLNGVHPETLLQKAMPNGLNISTVKPNIIACWRAHMNALVNVIENSYSTALIMEDDADWDVSIKKQLTEFARGLHALQGKDQSSQSGFSVNAPYGTNWDVLWIGGCLGGPSSNETKFYAIPQDPTVASVRQRGGAEGVPYSWRERFSQDSTRFIFQAETGCCLYGYAVTGRGARKIIAALSVDHLEIPIDNALSDLCGGISGRRRIDCYAPSPNYIGTFRRAGPSYRDSDIETYAENDFHEEKSWNMVYSTRRNIHRLVAGEETVHSQWRHDSETWQKDEITVKEFQYPTGVLVN